MKSCFLLLAFTALIQSACGAWQYYGTTPDGDFTYTATYEQTAGGAYEGTASITGYTGSASDVVIPSLASFTASPSGQDVSVTCTITAIQSSWGQPGVFMNKPFITSVSLPSTLQSIGASAFQGCSGLGAISIPPSVTSIGRYAFLGCVGITSLTLQEGLNSIEEIAFGNCTGLTHVSIPSSIGYMSGAFTGYDGPFTGCSNLRTVSIGRGADIGIAAFRGLTGLNHVIFTGQPNPSNPGSIADWAFRGCTSLSGIDIPEGTTGIGQGAFQDCNELTSVAIPSCVVDWGNSAFRNCTSLIDVTLQPGLTTIGSATFIFCTALEEIHIPFGVTNIGNSAFGYCANLADVSIPASVTRIEEGAFSGCDKLAGITIPARVTKIDNSAFAYCPLLDNVVVPSSVTNIGGYAFLGCTGLINITISGSVTSIEEGTFYGCTGLASVIIPSGVINIGQSAFYSCHNLKFASFLGNAPTMATSSFSGSPVTYYHSSGASGFTSPTWQGYPCFIAAPYGGVIPNLPINEAHLIGGNPADGNVKLEAPVTHAPLLWQRQTTPVTLDMETSRTLLLGATGTVRVDAGDGALTIGKNPGDGFLTAGGTANTPGTLVLDQASANDLTIHAVIINNGNAVVGLTKNGSGRAILSASNSYSGETSITGGTLVLKSARLADAAAVRVASGGSLNLDYPGTDVVGALYLGGAQQPDGLYGSANSGGLITGTGRIQVGPFASYSAWTDVNAPGQTTDQDHDHDGVANGIEYFMGKTGNDFTANPTLINGTVTWPKSPAFSGSYAVQTSADLVAWMDVTEDSAQVTKNAGSIVWTRPIGPASCFVRLVVVPN